MVACLTAVKRGAALLGLTAKPRRTNARRMADDAAPAEPTGLSFEAALKRLEEIVRSLESGEAPLDEAIKLYEEGDRLKRQCEARLKDAQMKIEQIQFDREGQPAGTAPFGEG